MNLSPIINGLTGLRFNKRSKRKTIFDNEVKASKNLKIEFENNATKSELQNIETTLIAKNKKKFMISIFAVIISIIVGFLLFMFLVYLIGTFSKYSPNYDGTKI